MPHEGAKPLQFLVQLVSDRQTFAKCGQQFPFVSTQNRCFPGMAGFGRVPLDTERLKGRIADRQHVQGEGPVSALFAVPAAAPEWPDFVASDHWC